MKRILWQGLVLGIVATIVSVAAPPLGAQDFSRTIVYAVPGMDKVEANLNVVYRRDAAATDLLGRLK